MAKIDISKLNDKQLSDLSREIEERRLELGRERIAEAKAKVAKLLEADGLTLDQLYGNLKSNKRGGKKDALEPKFRNPNGPETWSGRGRRPQWYMDALKNGKVESEMLIKPTM